MLLALIKTSSWLGSPDCSAGKRGRGERGCDRGDTRIFLKLHVQRRNPRLPLSQARRTKQWVKQQEPKKTRSDTCLLLYEENAGLHIRKTQEHLAGRHQGFTASPRLLSFTRTMQIPKVSSSHQSLGICPLLVSYTGCSSCCGSPSLLEAELRFLRIFLPEVSAASGAFQQHGLSLGSSAAHAWGEPWGGHTCNGKGISGAVAG